MLMVSPKHNASAGKSFAQINETVYMNHSEIPYEQRDRE
jgi:hypothetical protein